MKTLTWKERLKLSVWFILTVAAAYFVIVNWSKWSGFLTSLWNAGKGFLFGLMIAYAVNLLMSFYERHWFRKHEQSFFARKRRTFCLTLSYVSVLVIVALIVVLVIPQMIDSVSLLVKQAPQALNKISQNEKVKTYLPQVYEWLGTKDWTGLVNKGVAFLKENSGGLVGTVTSTIGATVSGVIAFFIGIVFSFYLLAGKESFIDQFKTLASRFIPAKAYDKTMDVLTVMNGSFRRFIVGQCTEAVILGGLCAVGMLILRLPYAVMIGVLVGFTALIPIIGGLIGSVAGVIMIIPVSPLKALIFFIFLMVLQQIEGNLIYPRVVGKSVGLPGIWVLLAVTVGGGIAGIPGILFSVPIASALYTLAKRTLDKQKAEIEKEPKMTSETAESNGK
ncbi:MAG: AI-2E family transporter [Clostridia bacterium]|nr:AI-2E family transporter [Clostridia bacterium]